MIVDVALALAIGVGLGVITGLPLGVVNVAVVATAARHGARAGRAVGLGGALADAVHATVAFAGLAPIIAARPRLADALTLTSGILLVAFALHLARPRRAPDAAPADETAPPPRGTLRRIAAGAALTLPNPAALAAWLAVAGALGPPRTSAAAIAITLGVGLGSAAYFSGLAHVAARSARHLTRPRWLDRGAALAIFTVGAIALVRAGWRFAA